VNIYLLQNFESIDTQTSLGGRYAYPIPYFDNGPATGGLHIGGACHEQGGSHSKQDSAGRAIKNPNLRVIQLVTPHTGLLKPWNLFLIFLDFSISLNQI